MPNRKRQSNIFFRSLTLPPSSVADIDGEGDKDSKNKPDYCPHFLPALQLIAHTLIPVRKALIHFYVTYRNKDVKRLEWLTLLGFGRLFRGLITASNSSGNSVLSGSSSANTGSMAEDMAANLKPVTSERFFPGLYTALLKHDLERWPKDVTEAIHVLLDCMTACARTIPVTNHLWSALLDKACTGLIVSQSLVGRRKKVTKEDKEVPQRSLTEQVILWCPHVFPISDISRIPTPVVQNKVDDEDDDDDNAPTLQQLIEADFRKRPLSTTTRSYYNFDKKSYDFEVQIPTKFLDDKDDDNDGESKPWKTTRSLQFASLTGYLFLGIDRLKGDKKSSDRKIDRSEVAIPATLDLTKLCKKGSKTKLPKEAIYELVGGALYDDGEYVAVLKDLTAAALAEEKKTNGGGGDDSDDEEETWKLMEAEETISMTESDVLEFLKGEGDDEDDSDDEGGPCGTVAVYKLRLPSTTTKATNNIFKEMDSLLSDIVISQISGSLNSKNDFYIEEEIYEEEIIED